MSVKRGDKCIAECLDPATETVHEKRKNVMKIAFMSDIHGVPSMLKAALSAADSLGYDRLVLLYPKFEPLYIPLL